MKKHRSTILISLSIGIAIFYLQPFLSFIGDQIIQFFIATSNFFSNYYYSKIAFDDPYLFDSFNNYLLSLATVFCLVMIHMFLRILKLKWSRRLQSRIDSNENQINLLENPINKEVEDKSKRIEELKVRNEELFEKLQKKDKLVLMKVVIGIITVLVFGNYIFLNDIAAKNISFRNKIIVLKPQVEGGEIDELNSKWHSMKNKNDYKEIMNKITELENSSKK